MEEHFVGDGRHDGIVPKQLHLILENIKEQMENGKFNEQQKR
jgi:hypothetical protein